MRFCSLCGGYYDFRGDHADCQPFDAKIQEVLRHMEDAGLSWQSDTLRAHLAALTTERDALRAYLKDKAIPVTPLCVEIEEQAQQRARDAHIEGLRWAQRECRYHGPGTVSEKIEAEIARLERPAPQDARLRADQEGEG